MQLSKIKDVYRSDTKFKKWLLKFLKKESPEYFPEDSIESMLLDCRKMEKGSFSTIYKLLQKLSLFSTLLIEDNRRLIKIFDIRDKNTIRKIGTFRANNEKTLLTIIELFFECYKKKYDKL